jgi:hypothetical protein
MLVLKIQASTLPIGNQAFSFHGNSSLHGTYKGEIEFRERNGSISVTRIMTYDSFQFENLTVQEIWTGQAIYEPEKEQFIIQYDLKEADFLKVAEGQTRNIENFKNKTRVVQIVSYRNDLMEIESFSRNNEIFNDLFVMKKKLTPIPLWENKRNRIESIGHESSSIFKFASSLLNLRVTKWLHSQPLAKFYSAREDFKLKKQFMIYDPTDYDFYQKNQDTLRVVNKIPDTISLIEEIQRRNAYAFSLRQKMIYFEEDMRKLHLNEFGLFSGALINEDGKFHKFLMDGDSSLWTGMYVAAEAMRYKATGEESALQNLKKSLNGLMLLMDITEDKREFARSVSKFDDDFKIGGNLHRGKNEHADKTWLSSGNNDMYKGLIHGFIWAYKTLPDSEKETRDNLLIHMKRLPDLEVANKIQNIAAAWGLRALATRSVSDRNLFIRYFNKFNRTEKLVNIEGTLHIGGIVDWSAVNLGMVGALTNILIADALNEDEIVHKAKKTLAHLWKDVAGTKRDFLTIATYLFAIKDGFDLTEVNELNDDYSLQDIQKLWSSDLKTALWSLKEIPLFRSRYNVSFDFSLQPEWCLSWWPRLPWKSIIGRQPPEYHYQGVDSYPLFEGLAFGSNFLWKDQAFVYQGESNKNTKQAGGDYLYTYWMARLAGLTD